MHIGIGIIIAVVLVAARVEWRLLRPRVRT
jgi:hypothetical protein